MLDPMPYLTITITITIAICTAALGLVQFSDCLTEGMNMPT